MNLLKTENLRLKAFSDYKELCSENNDFASNLIKVLIKVI